MITRTSASLPQPDENCTVLTVSLGEEDCVCLTRILRDSSWILKEVRSCREALALSLKRPPSVVLTEPRMPDGTWNTLREGLGDLAAPPAMIVVSRLADEHLWAEVLNLGGYDVLAAPFDRSEVLRVLYLAWMSRKREAQRSRALPRKPPSAERMAEPLGRRMSASSAG
jgi:DNA-binding NtrC family response regulator